MASYAYRRGTLVNVEVGNLVYIKQRSGYGSVKTELQFYLGVGKMRLVRLVRLNASATSNVCNSYQIKHLTLVYTLSLPLTLLISFFPYSKLNNTCPKRNRRGSGASVIFLRKIT